MGVTVKVTGGDKYKKFLAKMAKIAGGVRAGIPANATSTDGKSVAAYAIYNEFGATIRVTPKMRAWFHYQDIHLKKDTDVINIPARPFMRTVAKDRRKLLKWVGVMVKHIKGRAQNPAIWTEALGLAGAEMKADIQDSIQNGNWKPNAPATVKMKAAKGKGEADKPLWDTGTMYGAVIYEVMPK